MVTRTSAGSCGKTSGKHGWPGPGRHNFFDHSIPANAQRRHNLELYLQEMLGRTPKVLLLGEAPGFRGMGITGVPFTNRTMFDGPANSFGLFGPGKDYTVPAEAARVASEPTATVMWEVAGAGGTVRHRNVGGRGQRGAPQPAGERRGRAEGQAPFPWRAVRLQAGT